MRKCRVGKKVAKLYRNYANMFETMSLLDIVSWTVGVAAVSAAAGWAAGKIAEYVCDKVEDYNNIGTLMSTPPQYKTEKGDDDDE